MLRLLSPFNIAIRNPVGLLSRRNETVTRKEILMKVRGDDSFFNSRNLDVYLTKLRDYLQGDSAVEIITIKGVGYRFSVTAPA